MRLTRLRERTRSPFPSGVLIALNQLSTALVGKTQTHRIVTPRSQSQPQNASYRLENGSTVYFLGTDEPLSQFVFRTTA